MQNVLDHSLASVFEITPRTLYRERLRQHLSVKVGSIIDTVACHALDHCADENIALDIFGEIIGQLTEVGRDIMNLSSVSELRIARNRLDDIIIRHYDTLLKIESNLVEVG